MTEKVQRTIDAKRLSAFYRKIVDDKFDPDVIEQLPQKLGLSSYQYSEIRNDPRKAKLHHLKAFAEILEVTPIKLIRACKFGHNHVTLDDLDRLLKDEDPSLSVDFMAQSA